MPIYRIDDQTFVKPTDEEAVDELHKRAKLISEAAERELSDRTCGDTMESDFVLVERDILLERSVDGGGWMKLASDKTHVVD